MKLRPKGKLKHIDLSLGIPVLSMSALLAIGFIILIYWNSFNGVWQYDDIVNIVKNRNVHFQDLSTETLQKGLLRTGPLGTERIQRPLAYFSFALNYYWGDLKPWGYHLVNLIIHVIGSTILFFFIKDLLNVPNLAKRYGESSHWIAFFQWRACLPFYRCTCI
jgi:hypothetical protein